MIANSIVDKLRLRLSGRGHSRVMAEAARIPNWRSRAEADELFRVTYELADGATVVELGAFLGSGTVVMAGARRLRGSGRVHCVDPFDASGDTFSAPIYRNIAAQQAGTLRQQFDRNIARAGLSDWVSVHVGIDHEVARGWQQPIDLLLLDGDQSQAGARKAFDAWLPFLRVGGIVSLGNASDREYEPDHEGNRLVVVESIKLPLFSAPWFVGNNAFARRLA